MPVEEQEMLIQGKNMLVYGEEHAGWRKQICWLKERHVG